MPMDYQSGMKNKSPGDGGAHGVTTKTSLSQGKTRAAPFPDKSMGCKGGSVNSGPTRSETGKASGTIGPRTA